MGERAQFVQGVQRPVALVTDLQPDQEVKGRADQENVVETGVQDGQELGQID